MPGDRGYGRSHRNLRARWKPAVEAGTVTCWRCRTLITKQQARDGWDLGHDDHDRTQYRGPEHRACNRATSTHAVADPSPTPRQWWT